MENNDSNLITMVDRVGQIMNFIFESSSPAGISKIADELDLPKATVFRILNTLHKWNYVEKYHETDNYILGKALIKYGEKAKSNISLVEISSTAVKHLASQVGETVNLGIQYMENILTIFSEEGESSALVSRLIPISPLNCSSMGKIFLSNFTEEGLKEYFSSNKFQKRTINTIGNLEDFMVEREKILREKISYDNEEYEYGLSCMACPILDSKGNVIAAISVSGPTSRIKYKGIDKIRKSLMDTARTISEHASYL